VGPSPDETALRGQIRKGSGRIIVGTMVLAADLAEISFRLLIIALLAPVTTAISLRLLGTRRGWGAGLVSGAVGWGGGAIFAIGLSGWDFGADSLLIHITAIAHPGHHGGCCYLRPAGQTRITRCP
jgi:hypothetical protein